MGFCRKLLRRSFYAAAALSTLLLLATLIAWVASHDQVWAATYTTSSGDRCGIGAETGRMFVVKYASVNKPPGFQFNTSPAFGMWSYFSWKMESDGTGRAYEYCGLGWSHHSLWVVDPLLREVHITGFYVPCFYLSLIFALLPARVVESIRRQRKFARIGRCPKCGYDLRAHTPGTRCPECGTPIAT